MQALGTKVVSGIKPQALCKGPIMLTKGGGEEPQKARWKGCYRSKSYKGFILDVGQLLQISRTLTFPWKAKGKRGRRSVGCLHAFLHNQED